MLDSTIKHIDQKKFRIAFKYLKTSIFCHRYAVLFWPVITVTKYVNH